MQVTLNQQQKIKLWTQIVPLAVVVVSIFYLKVLAAASLALYLVGMLTFYRFIGKWESPVVERLLHLLKMLGISLGFVAVAVFIHAVIYIAA